MKSGDLSLSSEKKGVSPCQQHKPLLEDQVFQIVGAAMERLNQIGHGFHEKPYENALVVEFGQHEP